MDMSTISASLRMLQASVSTFAMSKAMGRDQQAMAALLADFESAIPSPAVLAPKAGSMDIRV